eukprot:CAMPEP_0194049540 /NCGR_PEP_ID=MMETSP0009_2-20130614/30743_1 /TAXON_ID=210454 /ORGANISM="Grammatophora oceanica, Strain CCMP 410" /LENGTH=45 /DNA_ID= /DNA_START= /DNA_END= /DNA_ORIENTATION=
MTIRRATKYNAWLQSHYDGEEVRNLIFRTDVVSAQAVIENILANE